MTQDPKPVAQITITLDEYLALQRLVGFAQSITRERHVTKFRETPYDMEQWHHPVTGAWRESLIAHAERAEKCSQH